MEATDKSNFTLFQPFPSLKIIAVESTLQQTISNFKDLVLDFEQLHIENKNFKNMLLTLKEESQSQKCSSCEELEKIIQSKEQIFDFVAAALSKLMQTKDFNLINQIFKEINRETNILTPPQSASPLKDVQKNTDQNLILLKQNNDGVRLNVCDLVNLKKETTTLIADGRNTIEESLSEIESTPTGRKSPVIQNRTLKLNKHCLNFNDKKKCPEIWPTPEKKNLKLLFPTPTRNKASGRLRQARLSLVKVKSCDTVDLTCSPEHIRDWNPIQNNIQHILKKEILDNDETILPSPTSDLVKLPLGYKSIIKDDPVKFEKPLFTIKHKMGINKSNMENKPIVKIENIQEMEESLNLLNQFSNRFESPVKEVKYDHKTPGGDESISLLQCLKKCDVRQLQLINSPNKRPLAENMNVINVQNHDKEASVSLLHAHPPVGKLGTDTVKRNKADMEVVYKEAAVRKKTEKRALPGWSCDECEQFYAELYKDDLDMLAQKMDECSKHRGRLNPIRPKTPDGFWNPRWEVPDDTEEFNRRNNV